LNTEDDTVAAERPSVSADAGAEVAEDRPIRQNMIWLASYPKSGNTWVRVFIHNVLRELHGETEGAQDINALHRFAIWEHSMPHYTKALGKPANLAAPAELAAARPKVQRLISSERPKMGIAKTHLMFGRDHGFPTIDLSVTRAAIYVVRNPLDVAVSYAHHCGRPVDAVIADMARPGLRTPPEERHIGELVGAWGQHVASWMGLGSRPVHLMRYEDMLESPERAFGTLCRFLNIQIDGAGLKRAVENSSFAELSRQEEKNGFVERPRRAARFFRAGKAGLWRHALTREQAEAVIRTQAPMMQRLRYLPPNSGAPPVGQSKRIELH
jgi:hypothetical protein